MLYKHFKKLLLQIHGKPLILEMSHFEVTNVIKSIALGEMWSYLGTLPCHTEVEVVFLHPQKSTLLKTSNVFFQKNISGSKKHLHFSASTRRF